METIMNEFDIVQEYKLAKSPTKQIGILADENQCSKKIIVEILKKNGCKLPGNYYNTPPTLRNIKPKPQPAPKVEPDPEEEKPEINWIPAPKPTLTGSPNLYRAAVEAIAKRLKALDGDKDIDSPINCLEQIRGILALIYELEVAE